MSPWAGKGNQPFPAFPLTVTSFVPRPEESRWAVFTYGCVGVAEPDRSEVRIPVPWVAFPWGACLVASLPTFHPTPQIYRLHPPSSVASSPTQGLETPSYYPRNWLHALQGQLFPFQSQSRSERKGPIHDFLGEFVRGQVQIQRPLKPQLTEGF